MVVQNSDQVYSYFERGCRKNAHSTIPKGNVGYDQYTVPDDCSCRTYFCCFPLALANTFPWPFVPILSNVFEKQRTQNHSQFLSGLLRALFPTTFLEIAVYGLMVSVSFTEFTRRSNDIPVRWAICYQSTKNDPVRWVALLAEPKFCFS